MAGHVAKTKETYTWADYVTWGDKERWELIAGEAFNMTPAPAISHQCVVGELYRQMANWFAGKRCQALVAPVDVKLSDEDVVQPDIIVVCNPESRRKTHIEGAPALVVEVLSPSTEIHDRLRKMQLFARAGVGEVWLVSPQVGMIEVYSLDEGSYRLSGTFTKGDTFKSVRFPKLQLNLKDVFSISQGMWRVEELVPYIVNAPPRRKGLKKRS